MEETVGGGEMVRWWSTSDETPGKAVGDRVGGRADVVCLHS